MAHCLSVLGVMPWDTRDRPLAVPGGASGSGAGAAGEGAASEGAAKEAWVQASKKASKEASNGAALKGIGAYAGRRERFHPFTPGQHLTWQPPKKKNANGMSADWVCVHQVVNP